MGHSLFEDVGSRWNQGSHKGCCSLSNQWWYYRPDQDLIKIRKKTWIPWAACFGEQLYTFVFHQASHESLKMRTKKYTLAHPNHCQFLPSYYIKVTHPILKLEN